MSNSEKDILNHAPTISQNNDQLTFSNVIQATTTGLLLALSCPVHIGASSFSHPIVDAYTDTYAATSQVFLPHLT